MIPFKLEDWNYETINDLVQKNICESDSHDFKKNIPDSETLTKVSCAFANTKGGFIVLGVKESGKNFEIVGIENDKDLTHYFGQKINAIPTIDFNLPKIINIPDTNKILAVFEIPLSSERPHVPNISPEKRNFQKRTNKGNDYMTYEEIKLSFQGYQERREKIKLLYIELLSNIEQLTSMKVADEAQENSHSLVTLDSTVINSLIVELFPLIGADKRLIQLLFTIREEIKVVNNKIKIFFSQVAMPLSNQKQTTKKHNIFINAKVEILKPVLQEALKIIEERFKFDNPFKE